MYLNDVRKKQQGCSTVGGTGISEGRWAGIQMKRTAAPNIRQLFFRGMRQKNGGGGGYIYFVGVVVPSCGSPFSFLCEGKDRPSFEKEKGVDYDVWEKQRRFKNGLDNGEVDQ